MPSIQKRVAAIEERNRRVELDKAWETSLARKIVISILTYIVVLIFFIVAKLPNPLLNSLLATVGFVLSTLTLTRFKKMWLKRQK